MKFEEKLNECLVDSILEKNGKVYSYDLLKDRFQTRLMKNDHLFVYEKDEHSRMNYAFFQYHSAYADEYGNEYEQQGELFWWGDGDLDYHMGVKRSYFAEDMYYLNTDFVRECCDIVDEYFR